MNSYITDSITSSQSQCQNTLFAQSVCTVSREHWEMGRGKTRLNEKNLVSRETDLGRHCCSLRIVSTYWGIHPKCSQHRFSPTAGGTQFVSQHKAQTWASGPISWRLNTNVKVEFSSRFFKPFLKVSRNYNLMTLFIQGTKAETLV